MNCASSEKSLAPRLVDKKKWRRAAQSPEMQQTVTAFNTVAPYLPNRPAAIRPLNDLNVDTASVQESVPDISLDKVKQIEDELKDQQKDDTPEAALVEDFVHLTYDNTVSDAMKKYLLHIGNPIISELASAFLDPLFGEPAERLIRAQAHRVMQDHFDRSASLAQVQEASQSLQSVVVQKVVAVQGAPVAEDRELGDPSWDRVRSILRRAVQAGLPGKNAAVQNDARAMMGRFDQFWDALNILVQDDEARRGYSEKVFSAYLKQTDDFVALWGFAVISITPEEYKSDLAETAEDIGPPSDKLDALRKLVAMREARDSEAKKILEPYDPENVLTSQSTNADFGRIWYAYHGPYPVHGYILYQKEIGDSPSDEAASYYNSERVGHFVNIYCPNNKETSAN